MKKYEKYIESGIEWIGEIPSSWKISRLKHQMEMITGFAFKSESFSKFGIKLARGINVKEGAFNWNNVRYWSAIEEHLHPFLLEEGDVLIGMDGSKIGKNFCIVEQADLPILLVQRVARLRVSDSFDNRFLYWQIANRGFLYWVDISKTDPMIPHIAPKDIKNFQVAFPVLSEQTIIANFLDYKTEQIDTIIKKKEDLIGKLKAQRQAIIKEVVTKGLSAEVSVKAGLKPNVSMQNSGIEWLGDIPEHWDIIKLKYAFNLVGGGTPSKLNDDYWEGSIPWVSPKDMKVDRLFKTEDYLTEIGLSNSTTNLVSEDTLLMVVRSGILQRTIPIALAGTSLTINQDIKAFIPHNIIGSKFLYYFIKGNERALLNEIVKQGATVESVEVDFLNNIYIPTPSPLEQNKIVEYLDQTTIKYDQLVNDIESTNKKLKQYRQSLISEAVTGKIDVRDWKKSE